ncbi:MAG: hypothetical protein WD607_05650 [Candidatus Paceibacterota bacterium]
MDNTSTDPDGITLYDQFIGMASNQTDRPSPKEVSESFFEMVEQVQKMNRETIDSLSNEEILELGKPILDATNKTIKLSDATLQELGQTMKPWESRIRSLTKSEHDMFSKRAINIVKSDRGVSSRSFGADKVREILLNLHGGVSTMSTTCESMFNLQGGYVHVQVGDNLNIANDICPAGSIFYVYAGEHVGQSVQDSKTGNTWVGVGGTVYIDGYIDEQNSVDVAFEDGMKDNNISWMEIRNYTDWGIISQSSSSTNIEIRNMTFRNIAEGWSGEHRAAIHFYLSKDVLVQYSYFNNVAHSIRFHKSVGPIKVLDNEALNTGFGFFQCNDCSGSDIKINNNSLEHTTKYGKEDLFDFINIYDSKGSNSSNRIQVNNNRARVNLVGDTASGVSQFGCAVLLGDDGGKYQEAINNIGVNPGACGIGLASGEHMYVSDNKMFSQAVQPGISNVGYYSANYATVDPTPQCTYHHYVSQSNIADWMCTNPEGNCDPNNPIENRADANGSCTDQNNLWITRSSLRDLIKNETLGAGIWNDW